MPQSIAFKLLGVLSLFEKEGLDVLKVCLEALGEIVLFKLVLPCVILTCFHFRFT